MNQPKRLMVMAGGTGGHVFPGLAVAHHLMEQGWQVRWLGTADRMEADLVPKHGIEIDFIRISGLRGKGIKALLLAPVRIFNAWRQARDIMKRFKPDVVLGMGGYVSGPGGLAAWSLGIPVVLHEQNGIAGLTNKWLAKIATKVMQAFPGAFPKADVVVCRSGALTVSEIAAAGLPALFVPFQHKDRQQYWNALPLEKAGAAKIFEQPQFTADAVATTLAGWNRDVLLEMAQRARATAIPDATERVAKEVSLAAQA